MMQRSIAQLFGRRGISVLSRVWSGSNGAHLKGSEAQIAAVLKTSFPAATNIQVNDVSGGCGAMYEILIESTEFKGKPIVKQHMMVTQSLKAEIKDMHGVRIHTQVPEDS